MDIEIKQALLREQREKDERRLRLMHEAAGKSPMKYVHRSLLYAAVGVVLIFTIWLFPIGLVSLCYAIILGYQAVKYTLYGTQKLPSHSLVMVISVITVITETVVLIAVMSVAFGALWIFLSKSGVGW